MELTILLSKVFGSYLIIGGLAYLIRQKYFMSVVHNFVEEKMLRVLVAASELIAGLFLIFTHNIWDSLPEGIISLIGWLLALEGIFYLLMPDSMVRKLIRAFNTRAWYIGGGLVSVALGAYLIGFAFGLL